MHVTYIVLDRSKDLVHLAHLLLVLEKDGRVEERHGVLVGALEHDEILARMQHGASLDDALGRSVVLLASAKAASTSTEATAASSATTESSSVAATTTAATSKSTAAASTSSETHGSA